MRSHHQVLSPVLVVLLILIGLAIPVTSHTKEKPFDRIVVFGTSLSDSGNAFVLNGDPTAFIDPIDLEGCDLGVSQNVPPYDALDEYLIPDGVYARGGHHVSNGATWIEQYARSQALAGTTRPALQNDGTEASNYAVGGARAREYPCRFNLQNQVNAYMTDFQETSPNTLVVIEMGSNDIRDTLFDQNTDHIAEALENIFAVIDTLYEHGARNFLVAYAPKIGSTPAVQNFGEEAVNSANALAYSFNQQLSAFVNNPDINLIYPEINIKGLDLYFILDQIITTPSLYGITNTSTPCVTPNIPPYTCAQPDTYVFWDGIHPTKAVHSIVAQAAMDLFEP